MCQMGKYNFKMYPLPKHSIYLKETFIDKLCKIAHKTIPKPSPNQKLWFFDVCKWAILDRKQYFLNF